MFPKSFVYSHSKDSQLNPFTDLEKSLDKVNFELPYGKQYYLKSLSNSHAYPTEGKKNTSFPYLVSTNLRATEKSLTVEYAKFLSQRDLIPGTITNASVGNSRKSSCHWRSATLQHPVNQGQSSKPSQATLLKASLVKKGTTTAVLPKSSLFPKSSNRRQTNFAYDQSFQKYPCPSAETHCKSSPSFSSNATHPQQQLVAYQPTKFSTDPPLTCLASQVTSDCSEHENKDQVSPNHEVTNVKSVPAILAALRDSNRFKHVIASLLPPPSPLATALSSLPLSTSDTGPCSSQVPNVVPFGSNQNRILIRAGNLETANFLVSDTFISNSKTLQHILACSTEFLEYQEKCILLPSIEPDVLNCLIKFISQPKSWVPQDSMLFEVAEAAFYLNFPLAVDACTQRAIEFLYEMESLQGLSIPLQHIFLKQLSIEQLIFAESHLLPNESSLSLRPYWLSHLHKHSSLLCAFEKCPELVTSSIRGLLSPSLALPYPTYSNVNAIPCLLESASYHFPTEKLSDTAIRFYHDYFEQQAVSIYLILTHCSDLDFPQQPVNLSSCLAKKSAQKYIRLKKDVSITVGERESDRVMTRVADESKDAETIPLPTFQSGSNASVIEVHGTHLTFAPQNKLTIFSTWPILHLKIEKCVMSPSRFQAFCEWVQATSHLKKLTFSDCFDDRQLPKLFQCLISHPSLESIVVSGLYEAKGFQDQSFIKGINSLLSVPHLKRLGFDHISFTPSVLIGLLDTLVECNTRLTSLDLSHIRLGYQAHKLVHVTWPALTLLDLQGNQIPPCTLLGFIDRLTASFPQLEHLDLSYNAFNAHLLERLCVVLPSTRLSKFLFNGAAPCPIPEIMYRQLLICGLPGSLSFLSLQSHFLPLSALLELISTRSIYLCCAVDTCHHRVLKQKIKQSHFPVVVWCDTILTNLPFLRRELS